jgi:hypothetical protein
MERVIKDDARMVRLYDSITFYVPLGFVPRLGASFVSIASVGF